MCETGGICVTLGSSAHSEGDEGDTVGKGNEGGCFGGRNVHDWAGNDRG